MVENQVREIYMVPILTPYLTEDFVSLNLTSGEAAEQMSEYGYNPEDLIRENQVMTPEGNLVALSKPFYVGANRPLFNAEQMKGSDLVIAGSTVPAEREVMSLMDSGIVVGRYSIFYGGCSDYSGCRPEEAGYSLDIPKNTGVVRALLQSDSFFESLKGRDETGIRKSLEELSRGFSNPIIVTPFLSTALSR
jgi:hypothetical protein